MILKVKHFPPFSLLQGNIMNIKLYIQYEGTRYRGWQRQKMTDQTIQGKLENILSRQFGREIEIHGSGRTDAGVHARCQVANFHLKQEEADGFGGNFETLTEMLNEYLPEDIAVLKAREASLRFHSRLNVTRKTYVYRIWNSGVPNVFERRYVCQMAQPLDTDAMRRAAQILCGEHDFAAFCGNPKMKKSTVRTIYGIEIKQLGPEIRLEFTGSGFLQNMVRILTGTLVEVGTKARSPEEMTEILESKDRQRAGMKMPSQGLILWEVKYD